MRHRPPQGNPARHSILHRALAAGQLSEKYRQAFFSLRGSLCPTINSHNEKNLLEVFFTRESNFGICRGAIFSKIYKQMYAIL